MLDLKTSPPTLRSGLVERDAVLSKLEDATSPVIIVEAPSGFGKTTVLAQFAARSDRPVAWLNLDDGDGDPKELYSLLLGVLRDAGLSHVSLPAENIESRNVLTRGVDLLLGTIDSSANGLLILDQVDRVSTQKALDVVGELMMKARGRITVVVGVQSSAALPIGALRARGDLTEVTATDLALLRDEADEVLREVGVEDVEGIDEILARTEFWPVAVYLAAVALRAGDDPKSAADIRGNHVFLADYIREKLMSDIPAHLEEFLVRSSLLPSLSADLCDFVLETEQSSLILDQIQRTNLLVVPLDRTRTWYRYHTLLREFLQAELHMRAPGLSADLHRRASEWFERSDNRDQAMEHARLSGDSSRVAGLLTGYARTLYATGRVDTLVRWFDWLERDGELERHGELASLGALVCALEGDASGADRLLALALHRSEAIESAVPGPLSLITRAILAPSGMKAAVSDGTAAFDALRQSREWSHVALAALALATLGHDGVVSTERVWADARQRGEAVGGWPVGALARGMQANIEIRRGGWDAAESHLRDGIVEMEQRGLDGGITSCLLYVEAARVAVHAGDHDVGRSHLAHASTISPLLSAGFPVYSVVALHEMARAYTEMADVAGARQTMRSASDILAARPRLGTLVAEHEKLREQLDKLPAGTVGPSSLTPAELRLLPLLVTHLTYPQIGERLYVSRHTIKTQAMSIYRKLDVSSRAEAVEAARDVGLLSS